MNIEQLETKLKEFKNIKNDNRRNRKLDDLGNIKIDTNLPIEERIERFFKEVNDPYLIKVGNVVVEMEFSEKSKLSPIECIDEALISDSRKR